MPSANESHNDHEPFAERLRLSRPLAADLAMASMPFLTRLKIASIEEDDPWSRVLTSLRGLKGEDGVERISTDAIFDLIELQPYQRTAEAGKRLKLLMVSLGWVPVRARHVTSRGWASRVRGYAIMR